MTPRQEQAIEALKRLGNISDAALELGITYRGITRILDRAGYTTDVRQQYLDPAIRKGMHAIGTNMVPALAWAKIPPKDGEIGYSLMLKPEAEPPDAYAAGMGYGGRRALQSITFHKADGLVLRALDPIDREVG